MDTLGRIQIDKVIDHFFRDKISGRALVAWLAARFPTRHRLRRSRSAKAICAGWLGTVARIGAKQCLKLGDTGFRGFQAP